MWKLYNNTIDMEGSKVEIRHFSYITRNVRKICKKVLNIIKTWTIIVLSTKIDVNNSGG
jgi:hypothetical protein